MDEDTNLADLNSAIPMDLSEKSLVTVLTSGNLIATQANVVYARWQYIIEAKLLMRKCLTYNLSGRHFALPASHRTRTVAIKRRNLESMVQQIWQRRDDLAAGRPGTKFCALRFLW